MAGPHVKEITNMDEECGGLSKIEMPQCHENILQSFRSVTWPRIGPKEIDKIAKRAAGLA